jgi:chromatin segregation and condensation protein Rec8/ScpA/Scc1 (kleisin family)
LERGGLWSRSGDPALVGTLSAPQRLPAEPEPELLQRVLVNVAERRESVLAAIRLRDSVSFAALIVACRTRIEAIVTFLAVLDLLKTEDIEAEQTASFGEISLRLPGAAVRAGATA